MEHESDYSQTNMDGLREDSGSYEADDLGMSIEEMYPRYLEIPGEYNMEPDMGDMGGEMGEAGMDPMGAEPMEQMGAEQPGEMYQAESVMDPSDQQNTDTLNDLILQRMEKRRAAGQSFQQKAASLNRSMAKGGRF